jgi:hypothetical protein
MGRVSAFTHYDSGKVTRIGTVPNNYQVPYLIVRDHQSIPAMLAAFLHIPCLQLQPRSPRASVRHKSRPWIGMYQEATPGTRESRLPRLEVSIPGVFAFTYKLITLGSQWPPASHLQTN